MSTQLKESVEIDITTFRSSRDGRIVVQVETYLDDDEPIRITLNDGVLFDGLPTDGSPMEELLRSIYDTVADGSITEAQREEIKSRIEDLLAQ